MATNPYFHPAQPGYTSEHNLYEDMIIESIQWSGLDYVYIPRKNQESLDMIFGEDVLAQFQSHAIIEMYLEDVTQYGGESEMLQKFQFECRDTASFIISRKRYFEVVTPIVPEDRPEILKYRPNEGDLIYAPFSKSLFEIKFIEDEYPGFYQLNKKYVWAIRCELVQFNNDKFSTGNEEVDSIFGNNANRLDNTIVQEDLSNILTEDGGFLVDENYAPAKDYDELLGYGDTDHIKKEFLEIMSFDEKNPFNEQF